MSAAQARLAAWLEGRDQEGWKVEFETDMIHRLDGKVRQWWCDIRSVFEGHPHVRAAGDDMDDALDRALEEMGAEPAMSSGINGYAVAVSTRVDLGDVHVVPANDYVEAEQYREVIESVHGSVKTTVVRFEEPEDVMSIVRTELTE